MFIFVAVVRVPCLVIALSINGDCMSAFGVFLSQWCVTDVVLSFKAEFCLCNQEAKMR